MEGHRKTNFVNGLLSSLVLISGIVISAVGAVLAHHIYLHKPNFTLPPTGWKFGFAYMIPGITGIFATIRRQHGWYILQSVLMVLSLVVMGVPVFIGLYDFIPLLGLIRSLHCSEDLCNVLGTINALAITLVVFYIVSWSVALAAAITSGILGFSRKITKHIVQPPVKATVIELVAQNQEYGVDPGHGQAQTPNVQYVSPPPSYASTFQQGCVATTSSTQDAARM